jgi:hypothetical protein
MRLATNFPSTWFLGLDLNDKWFHKTTFWHLVSNTKLKFLNIQSSKNTLKLLEDPMILIRFGVSFLQMEIEAKKPMDSIVQDLISID